MKNIILLPLMILMICLSGCNQKEQFDRSVENIKTTFYEEQIELLKNQKFDALKNTFHFALKRQNGLDQTLDQMSKLFPNEKEHSKKIIAHRSAINTINGVKNTNTEIVLEYEYSNIWLIISLQTTQAVNEATKITNFNVSTSKEPMEIVYAFSLKNKTLYHFLLLSSAIIIPLLILYALIMCIKTPLAKRKWLWILFILFGIGGITLNWTTGDFFINPLYFQLFGSGYARLSPYSPVMLKISLPLGAILFLLLKEKLSKKARDS